MRTFIEIKWAGLTEAGNTEAAGSHCPLCKHTPFFSNLAKAARGTARSYLKNSLASVEPSKTTETPTPAPPAEPVEVNVPRQDSIPDDPRIEGSPTNGVAQDSENVPETTEQAEQSGDVIQSIEVSQVLSRQPENC